MYTPKGSCRRRLSVAAIALLSSVCLLSWHVVVSSAASRPAAERGAILAVHGTNGYFIQIRMSSKAALVIASRGHRAALYETERARVSDEQFMADFGNFGTIKIAFSPSASRPQTHSIGCGGSERSQAGRFVGKIVFRGEASFTVVNLNKADGTAITRQRRSTRRTCKREYPDNQRPGEARSKRYELEGTIFGPRSVVGFEVGAKALKTLRGWQDGVGVPLGLDALERAPTRMSAISLERRFGVPIVRLAAASSQDRLLAGQGSMLLIKSRRPFFGSARINTCRPRSLLGDFGVAFPGKEIVLAGHPAFVVPSPAGCEY
jgi:hypothetical protein